MATQQRVDQSFPRKFVTNDDPCEDKSHDDVDRGGNKRGFEGDRIARHNSWRGGGVSKFLDGQLGGKDGEGTKGNDDDQA